jgi:hypothetical protein
MSEEDGHSPDVYSSESQALSKIIPPRRPSRYPRLWRMVDCAKSYAEPCREPAKLLAGTIGPIAFDCLFYDSIAAKIATIGAGVISWTIAAIVVAHRRDSDISAGYGAAGLTNAAVAGTPYIIETTANVLSAVIPGLS